MELDNLSELEKSNFELSMQGLFPTKIIHGCRCAEGKPYRAHEPGTFVWVDLYGLDCGDIRWSFKGQHIKEVEREENRLVITLSEKPVLMQHAADWENMAELLSPEEWAERTFK